MPATPSLLAMNSCTLLRADASSTASRMLARAFSAPTVMGLEGPALPVASADFAEGDVTGSCEVDVSLGDWDYYGVAVNVVGKASAPSSVVSLSYKPTPGILANFRAEPAA